MLSYFYLKIVGIASQSQCLIIAAVRKPTVSAYSCSCGLVAYVPTYF